MLVKYFCFVVAVVSFPSTIDDAALLPIPPHYFAFKEVGEFRAWVYMPFVFC